MPTPTATTPEAGWLRRLWPWIAAHRAKVWLAFGGAVVGMVAVSVAPVVQRSVIDDVVIGHHGSLATLLLILVVLGVLRFGSTLIRRYTGGKLSVEVPYDIRNDIFEHLQQLDFASHDSLQTGQLVSRANADLNMVQALLAWVALVLGNVVQLAVSLALMAWLSPLLCGLSVLVVLASFAAAWRMRKVVYVSTWDASQREAEMTAVVEEAVTGVRVVKGFGQERNELRRLIDAVEVMFGARTRNLRHRAKFGAVLQTLPGLGQLAVLAAGGWLALHGHLTVGTLLAFFTYLTQLGAPARTLAMFLTAGQQARAGMERILELLDATPLVVDAADAVDLEEPTGAVRFDDVTFGYSRHEPVLCHFDLDVAAGDRVALVGASGSGKSTVALLLPRFYDPLEGSVRLDGHDLRSLTTDSVRRHIGVVFEETFLFSDTIAANIAYGRPDATPDQIRAAARAAEADGFIEALPDGYDTDVGERGLTLSGGQRQRIALARALLTDPRILILDDATSSVDARVEHEIHQTLERLMENRTTLLIAHRRSTLRLADRIVVLDTGRVIDEGTHGELVERCERYRELLAGDAETLDSAPAFQAPDEAPDDGCVTETALEADSVAAESATELADLPASSEVADGETQRRVLVGPMPAAAAPSGGRGGGSSRGGMGGGHRFLGPPTPELLAAIEAMPPPADASQIDADEHIPDRGGLRLFPFLRPWRHELGLGLFLVVLDAVATLAGPTLIKIGIDRGVVHGSRNALWAASAIFLAVTLFDWWDMWADTLVTGRTAERVLVALRVRVFAHLQRLGLDFYEREMAGRILTRMTSDVDTLSNLLQNGLINAVVNVVTFLGMLVVLFVLSPLLALATLALIPPLGVATMWFRRRSSAAYDRQRDRIAIVNADLQENLSGVRETQAFRRQAHNVARFRVLGAAHRDAGIEAIWIQARYFAFAELLASLGTAMILGLGAAFVHSGSITVGVLVAFLLYLTQFFAPIQQLSQVFDSWQKAGAGMRKLDELLTTSTSVPDVDAPVPLPRLRGALRFDRVRFRYRPEGPWALDGIDVDLRAGESVALVGETGSGKSTMVKLAARFYDPQEGRVLVDGIDLTSADQSAYRQQLGYVPQEPFLFAGTVAENLAYGRPTATRAELRAAAEAVGLHERVMRLPGGYDHVLVERGRSLSTGERQLLCLARALVVDPAILVLDEATSNLDLASEARINRAMSTACAGRTSITIAHRLPTARRASRILVLDNGHVVEDGDHDALLNRGGRYAAMWRAFAESDEPAAARAYVSGMSA